MASTTVTALDPHQPKRQKGMLKRVLNYLQSQAVENSSPRSFLSPPGLEPHQRISLKTDSRGPAREYITVKRLSDATTAVDSRQNTTRPPIMAGDGIDAALHQESISTSSIEMKKVQYAQDNILQNYRMYIPQRNPDIVEGDQYWIIYIHGGYFRDPKVEAASFLPALELLTAGSSLSQRPGRLQTVPESATPSPSSSQGSFSVGNDLVSKHIAGYASINYRLAPHPGYPQDDQTEKYIKRDAKFPQQLEDVHAAIRHLQTRHEITNKYILAGHSVGATLAFLAALKAKQGQIDPPACVVGLNGIYDFPLIHEAHPEYRSMTNNAMSSDQYETASPALYPQGDFAKILPEQTLQVCLSHSKDDGLVDWEQTEEMMEVLQAVDSQSGLRLVMNETKGRHDSIWRGGKELARVLTEALEMMTDS